MILTDSYKKIDKFVRHYVSQQVRIKVQISSVKDEPMQTDVHLRSVRDPQREWLVVRVPDYLPKVVKYLDAEYCNGPISPLLFELDLSANRAEGPLDNKLYWLKNFRHYLLKEKLDPTGCFSLAKAFMHTIGKNKVLDFLADENHFFVMRKAVDNSNRVDIFVAASPVVQNWVELQDALASAKTERIVRPEQVAVCFLKLPDKVKWQVFHEQQDLLYVVKLKDPAIFAVIENALESTL